MNGLTLADAANPSDVTQPIRPTFEKQCQRCGVPVQAIRSSKRFCASCLIDHRKPAREQSRPSRRYRLKKYGLTLDAFDAMSAARGGRCDICRQIPANQGGSLCVDHDHDTGRVRGLLCSPCNRAIGLLGDNAAALGRAVSYLRRAERQAPTKGLEAFVQLTIELDWPGLDGVPVASVKALPSRRRGEAA